MTYEERTRWLIIAWSMVRLHPGPPYCGGIDSNSPHIWVVKRASVSEGSFYYSYVVYSQRNVRIEMTTPITSMAASTITLVVCWLQVSPIHKPRSRLTT